MLVAQNTILGIKKQSAQRTKENNNTTPTNLISAGMVYSTGVAPHLFFTEKYVEFQPKRGQTFFYHR